MGVWIETKNEKSPFWIAESHPSWVCGLKLGSRGYSISNGSSHPSWVCGLKQESGFDVEDSDLSHPSWVCGLKLIEATVCAIKVGHTLRGCVD